MHYSKVQNAQCKHQRLKLRYFALKNVKGTGSSLRRKFHLTTSSCEQALPVLNISLTKSSYACRELLMFSRFYIETCKSPSYASLNSRHRETNKNLDENKVYNICCSCYVPQRRQDLTSRWRQSTRKSSSYKH